MPLPWIHTYRALRAKSKGCWHLMYDLDCHQVPKSEPKKLLVSYNSAAVYTEKSCWFGWAEPKSFKNWSSGVPIAGESVQSRRLQSLAWPFSGLMNSHFPFGTGAFLPQEAWELLHLLPRETSNWCHPRLGGSDAFVGGGDKESEHPNWGNLPPSCSLRKSQTNCWAVMYKTLTSTPVNESISSFHDCQGTSGVLWTCLLYPASMNWGTSHESQCLWQRWRKSIWLSQYHGSIGHAL